MEDLNKDKLTRAMEESFGVDINEIVRSEKPKPEYTRSDLSTFNDEIAGIFDPVEALVLESEKSAHIQLEKKPISTPKAEKTQAKSLHKIQYSAEKEAIKKRIGSIAVIRKNLGLNQRKISQLLLVDPSAWNRWEKAGNDAPFYIYKALEWYSIVSDKHPSMGNSFWLQLDSLEPSKKMYNDIKSELSEELSLKLKDNKLKQQLNLRLCLLGLAVFSSGIFLGSLLV